MTIIDRDARIADVNVANGRSSQNPHEALIGDKAMLLRSGQQPPESFAHVWAEIAAGRSWRAEICNRYSQGKFYWVDSAIAPLVGLSGKTERYVSNSTAITH